MKLDKKFKLEIPSAEEFAKEFESKGFGNKPKKEVDPNKTFPFSPGRHTVKASEEKDYGDYKADPTWKQRLYTYEGVGRRTIRQMVFIPTKSIYVKGGTNQTWAWAKLVEHCRAFFNEELTRENAQELIEKLYIQDNQSIGKPADIQVISKGYYAKFVEKGVYHCCSPLGEPLEDDKGNPAEFPSWGACKDHCEDVGIKWGQMDVSRVYQCSNPEEAAKIKLTKKVESKPAVTEEESDLPF